jgi:hypothetical protein
MSLRLGSFAQCIQSTRIACKPDRCLLSIALLAVTTSANAQESVLRIAFPRQGTVGKVADAQEPESSKIRLRQSPSDKSSSDKSSSDKTSSNDVKDTDLRSTLSREDLLGDRKKDEDRTTSDPSATRSSGTVKPATETKRDPIVLPILSVPKTTVDSNGAGAMPDDMVSGRLPPPMMLPYGSDRKGIWSPLYKTWTAPVYCHQPTYFHDTMLEEHGHERCWSLQPLVSGARFYSQVAFWRT